MESDISMKELCSHPIVEELIDVAIENQNLNNVKIPYIMKNKILMSPGVWNNYFYSPEEIKKAFEATDWEDKEIRSLFLDHVDKSAKHWIGEIKNPRMNGDDVIGDLVVVDRNEAAKLAYGAKFGISPKVAGIDDEGSMKSFKFENMSIVINPAVKTAYINNSEFNEEESMVESHDEKKEIIAENALVTAMEKKRKAMGKSVSEFYAIPRDPPSESKLPIFDAAHVRNALARFNQVKGVSAEERAKAKRKIIAAAKKFGIKVGSVDKKMEEEMMEEKNEEAKEEVKEEAAEEDVVEGLSEEELMDVETLSAWSSFVAKKKKENPDMPFSEIAKAFKKKKEMSAGYKELGDEELIEILGDVTNELNKRKKLPAVETKKEMSEDNTVMQKLQEKVVKLEKKLNEPEKTTVRLEGEPAQETGDVDMDMLNLLRSNEGGSIQ